MPPRSASSSNATLDLSGALARLTADPDAIAWPQRRELVHQIAGPLSEGLAGDPFRSLFILLANDAKWEVRQEVAESLATIPDHDLAALGNQLLGDAHAYVRRAAKQSIERRRALMAERNRRKRGVDLVVAIREELEQEYGPSAAEKARRLSEELYDTMIGATVHEMRSILTAIKQDNSQLIERDHDGRLDPAFLRRKTGKIAQRLDFMERLLVDMRNHAQAVAIERVTVPVDGLVAEAVNIVSGNLKARKLDIDQVTLQISVPADLTAPVSRVHLVTAIVNILKNAYEFLPSDDSVCRGVIGIRAQALRGDVEITITDTGQGIPAASLNEVRQCLPGRTSRRHIGTGFGLCNARRYVEAHGGSLTIDSTEDVGTTVRLLIPSK